MKHTFRTKLHRAQLAVWDFTSPEIPAPLRKDKPYFSAAVLPASAHFSTTYAGHSIYYGVSLEDALTYIGNMIGLSSVQLFRRLPRHFGPYVEFKHSDYFAIDVDEPRPDRVRGEEGVNS